MISLLIGLNDTIPRNRVKPYAGVTASDSVVSLAASKPDRAPRPATSDPSMMEIRYRPCPVCRQLMNRFNFARSSGVILDSCKPHGIWFDPDELRRIVAFIRSSRIAGIRRSYFNND